LLGLARGQIESPDELPPAWRRSNRGGSPTSPASGSNGGGGSGGSVGDGLGGGGGSGGAAEPLLGFGARNSARRWNCPVVRAKEEWLMF
jgi:hypothetical protein